MFSKCFQCDEANSNAWINTKFYIVRKKTMYVLRCVCICFLDQYKEKRCQTRPCCILRLECLWLSLWRSSVCKTLLKSPNKRPLCTRRLQLHTLVIKIAPFYRITVLDFSDEHITCGPVTANDTLGIHRRGRSGKAGRQGKGWAE